MYGRQLAAETGSSTRSRYDSAVLMRRSLQPDLGPAGTNTATDPQGHDITNPPSKSWRPTNRPTRHHPPSTIPDPPTTALTNARRTTTTLDALSWLLTTLLTAQTPSSCPRQLPHDPSASSSSNTNTNTNPVLTDVRIPPILPSLHRTFDHSPRPACRGALGRSRWRGQAG